jgi:uncharacterized protein (TIGR02145 family)
MHLFPQNNSIYNYLFVKIIPHREHSMKPHIPSHQAYTYKPVYTANNLLFLLAFLLVLLPTWVSAQITGRVVDSDNNNLEGVHISALHNGAQTTSGADGSFSLELLEDPVGIRGQDFLGGNVPFAQGSHLQMNLQSGQLEVYTQSGVYDLQGKFLRVGENAGVYRYGEKGALRKALAQADTLVFVKAGYVTVRVEITDDEVDLGDVVLEEAIGSFTDTRDGKVYSTTTIGTQTWMAENLNFDAGAGSYCYGDNGTNCDTYGRLYTWEAAMSGSASSSTTPSTVQGVCPAGWHLPSNDEWTILSDYVIANSAGTSTDDIGPYLKATSGWGSSRNGTDNFAFSGLPGGLRYESGRYDYVGINGSWWSSTESNNSRVNNRGLIYDQEKFFWSTANKSDARSVRCLANVSPTVRIASVSPKTLVVGSPASFRADTILVFNESSAAVVTWSVNEGVFGSAGTDFLYTPASQGKGIIIAKIVQNGIEAFDTVYIMVYAGIFTDGRDNKEYLYTTIGNQTWMAQNLNYESTEGSYCFGNIPDYCDNYGRLYTWDSAMGGATTSSMVPSGVQGVCPVGWHLPSDAEWAELTEYVGGEGVASIKLKATTGWNYSGNGTDDFGFSGLPGGYRTNAGHYFNMGRHGYWWSSTESSNSGAYYRFFYDHDENFDQVASDKLNAYSVRCIMN